MIKLGSKVKDKVTGITGTATARLEHLFGDPQVFVEIADGSIRLTEWYYEQRLQPIDEKAVASVTTLAERSADA